MALYYPPVGFHFKVEFERFPSNNKDIRFKEVGGLSVEIPVENLTEGGENRFKYSLPAAPQYPKLVLKRGLLGDSQIADWCKKAIEDFVFETDNITVSLLNEDHEPLALWRIIGAYPCKWSVSDLNADQNAIVVESIEFAYQYFIYEKNP